MNSLINNIASFIEILRLAGVRISMSESIDAVNALTHVNILDKDEVEIALGACLAKSELEREIYYEAFDRFFINPALKTEYIDSKIKAIENKRAEIIEEATDLKFQGEQLEIREELKEVYSSLSEEEKQSIIEFLEKTSVGKNVGTQFKNMAENMVQGKLSSLKQKYRDTTNSKSAILENFASEAGIIAGEIVETIEQREKLLYKNIGNIKDEDMPRVIQLIKQITEKLRKSALGRYKNSNKRARLDFKKTIRSNIATGGILFKLKYRRKPKRRQRLLVLCDVSASMYRFSGFVLQLLAGLHMGISSLESYIFSEGIEHLNINQFSNGSDIEQRVMQSKIWRKGTDINKAIQYLLKEKNLALSSSTVVIIVSDAKTLNTNKAAENLKVLRGLVKKCYWLNPLQEGDWKSISGIENFKKHSNMLDCSTIDRLARACAQI